MLKLSKKVDYGLILLGRLHASGACPGAVGLQAASAREMAERYGLPLPMVANILKSLTGAGILTSTRGAQGGYALARDATRISLADLVEALDGPISLTDCTSSQTSCGLQEGCPMHSPVQRVHTKFREFMASFTLAELFAGADVGRTARPRAGTIQIRGAPPPLSASATA